MREIKLRACRKDKLYYGGTILKWLKNASEKGFNMDIESETVFMQYTGLKDKNDDASCDVYEHDILTNGTGNFYKVEWDYRDTGWCGIQINNTKKHRLINLLLRDSIVVGNIYENKDLLKQQDGKQV